MATSGSYNFTANRDDIAQAVLRKMRVIGRGEAVQSEDINETGFCLNTIIKQWAGNNDFAKGFKLWARVRATLIPQLNQYEYQIGPNGDHVVETANLVTTTLTANSAASDTTWDVTSDDGIADADIIGVRMDSGTIHWTTVNGTPAADVVTVTTGPTALASSGATVYAYTAKAPSPVDILNMNVKYSDGSESPLSRIRTVQGYEAGPDKDATGTPTAFYFEPRYEFDDGLLYFDLAHDDTTQLYPLVYTRSIQDFDAATDDIDMPAHWVRPLIWQGVLDMCTEYNKSDKYGDWKLNRDEALMLAQNFDPEVSDDYFQPDLDE